MLLIVPKVLKSFYAILEKELLIGCSKYIMSHAKDIHIRFICMEIYRIGQNFKLYGVTARVRLHKVFPFDVGM